MGISWFKWLRERSGAVTTKEISCQELFEATQEYQIRELSFWVCVNMIANALARCEFKTFRNGKEVFEREHYLWNIEPNANQNSTAFLHKLVARLCQDNEALIISSRRRDGYDALVVADDWQEPPEYPSKQNEYKGVRVGEVTYDKTFRESEVLHLKLNHINMRPVIDGLYASYYRLVQAAVKHYEWNHGQHWKVHVTQVAQGEENWAQNFQNMMSAQFKPFLESNGAVLPEFDGYKYENVGGTSGTVGGGAAGDTRDIRKIIEDIFDFTARAFNIPAVLINGTVEGTKDAHTRFLTGCIDPLCDQLQEEITRKRYGYEQWKAGNFLRVDSSSILHFDLFANAANVEKLVGSGAYTINDVLRAANQAPINEPWANEHYMTLNIGSMQSNVRAMEAPAQKGGTE